jgi:uncharacterized protein
MKVLISGGTGLLGAALVGTLLGDGHEVAVLTRSVEPEERGPGLRFLRWDGRTANGWGEMASRYDHWVHLAGENVGDGRWTAAKKRRIRDSRLASGAALVDSATRFGAPKVLLQASGIGFYGAERRADVPVTEHDPPGADFLADVAVAWEDSTAALEKLGTRRVVMRTGVVLARDGGALPKLARAYRLFVGGNLGTGKQWISWIHWVDHVRAMRLLLEDPAARGAFHLSAPEPVRQREFGRRLARVLHRPHWLPTPAPLLRAVLGEMATVVLTGVAAFPQRLLERGFAFHFPELESALVDLLASRGDRG